MQRDGSPEEILDVGSLFRYSGGDCCSDTLVGIVVPILSLVGILK